MDDTPFRKLDKPAYMPQPPPVETSDDTDDGKTGEQEEGQGETFSEPWDGSLLPRGEKLLPYGPDAIFLLSQLPEMYTNYANPKYEYVNPLLLAESHSLHALASKSRRQLPMFELLADDGSHQATSRTSTFIGDGRTTRKLVARGLLRGPMSVRLRRKRTRVMSNMDRTIVCSDQDCRNEDRGALRTLYRRKMSVARFSEERALYRALYCVVLQRVCSAIAFSRYIRLHLVHARVVVSAVARATPTMGGKP